MSVAGASILRDTSTRLAILVMSTSMPTEPVFGARRQRERWAIWLQQGSRRPKTGLGDLAVVRTISTPRTSPRRLTNTDDWMAVPLESVWKSPMTGTRTWSFDQLTFTSSLGGSPPTLTVRTPVRPPLVPS